MRTTTAYASAEAAGVAEEGRRKAEEWDIAGLAPAGDGGSMAAVRARRG